MIDYTLIRSSRRTLSIQVSHTGELIARAPMRMSVSQIEHFIMVKKDWIEKKIKSIKTKAPKIQYTDTEIIEMKKKLRAYIVPRVHELWEGRGLPQFTSIRITKSEGRWGSCSGKNGLCFSYRLAEWLPKDTDTQTDTQRNCSFVSGTKNMDSNVSSVTVSVPIYFIDAIIIHELAHLREKSHQRPFWNLVYSMMPEYESIMRNRENLD